MPQLQRDRALSPQLSTGHAVKRGLMIGVFQLLVGLASCPNNVLDDGPSFSEGNTGGGGYLGFSILAYTRYIVPK